MRAGTVEEYAWGIVSCALNVIANSGSIADGLPYAWSFHLAGFVFDERAREALRKLPPSAVDDFSFIASVCREVAGDDGVIRFLPEVSNGDIESAGQAFVRLYQAVEQLHESTQRPPIPPQRNPAAMPPAVSHSSSKAFNPDEHLESIHANVLAEVQRERLEQWRPEPDARAN